MTPQVLNQIGEAAKAGGYPLVLLVVALAVYTQREKLGDAMKAWGLKRRARIGAQVVGELNGKLVEAVQKAIAPTVESVLESRVPVLVDARIREAHGHMSEAIEDLKRETAQQSVQLKDLKYQGDKTADATAATRAGVARIEGYLAGKDGKTLPSTASMGRRRRR